VGYAGVNLLTVSLG